MFVNFGKKKKATESEFYKMDNSDSKMLHWRYEKEDEKIFSEKSPMRKRLSCRFLGIWVFIKEEKEKVLNDPELTSKFNEIDKALNANNELRKFRTYLENNPEIIKEFIDFQWFKYWRKRLWRIIKYL